MIWALISFASLSIALACVWFAVWRLEPMRLYAVCAAFKPAGAAALHDHILFQIEQELARPAGTSVEGYLSKRVDAAAALYFRALAAPPMRSLLTRYFYAIELGQAALSLMPRQTGPDLAYQSGVSDLLAKFALPSSMPREPIPVAHLEDLIEMLIHKLKVRKPPN